MIGGGECDNDINLVSDDNDYDGSDNNDYVNMKWGCYCCW